MLLEVLLEASPSRHPHVAAAFSAIILPYSSVAVNCKVRAADDGAAGA